MKSNKIEPFIFNLALSTHRDNRHCQQWIFPSEISPQLINYLELTTTQLLPSIGACHGWRAWILIARQTTQWRLKPLLFIYFLGTDFATWHMPQPLGSDHNCGRQHNNVWTVYYLQFSRHALSLCLFYKRIFSNITLYMLYNLYTGVFCYSDYLTSFVFGSRSSLVKVGYEGFYCAILLIKSGKMGTARR